MAMGPMIRTLYQHPESGFLGARTLLSWRGVTVLQYWRSFEDVERFARNPGDLHMKAWRRFNQTVGYKTGSVGIWHETYAIERGHYETLYGNMPLTGLAAATNHVRVGGGSETARQRIHAVPKTTATATVQVAAQTSDDGGAGEREAGA
jgi:hypothetical protein